MIRRTDWFPRFPIPRLRRAGGMMALALVLSGAADARASQILSVDLPGSFSDLIAFSARYDRTDASGPTTYYAGTLTGSLNGGPSFDTYCVDLYHTNYFGGGTHPQYLVDPLPIAQLTSGPGGNGAGVGYLYDRFAPLVAAESAGSAKEIDAAALQVALWKVEYDNGGPLKSGHFTVGDSSDSGSDQHLVYDRASYFLSFYTGTQSGRATWLEAVDHPVDGNGVSLNQNMIGPPTTAPTPVPTLATPEPGSLAMAGLGALGLLAYRWKAARRAGTANAPPLT